MRGAAKITAGTIVATIAAYLFQLAGGRTFGATDFAPITALWTVQFIAMHVVYIPIEEYAIRQLRLGRRLDWPLVVTVIGLTTGLTLAFVWGTLDLLFAGDGLYLLIAAATALGYGGFTLVRANLASSLRFGSYGMATGAEGLLRLVVAVAFLSSGARPATVAWAIAIAPLAAFAWTSRIPASSAAPGAAPSARAPGAGLLLPIVGAGLCAQLLIGAAPVVVGLLGGPASMVSIVFVTFALLRGPLWIVRGLLARVLPALTEFVAADRTPTLRRWNRRIASSALATGALLAVVGGVAGPAVIRWMFGPEFTPPALLTATVSAGVGLAAAGMFVNQILIALGRTSTLMLAWFAGLVAATAVLALDLPIDVRVGTAFLAGQLVALACLFAAIERRSTSARARVPEDRPAVASSVPTTQRAVWP